MKHHEASFLEDYTFQQAMPYIHALRDPVCNRVTLVGWFVCVSSRGETHDFWSNSNTLTSRNAWYSTSENFIQSIKC